MTKSSVSYYSALCALALAASAASAAHDADNNNVLGAVVPGEEDRADDVALLGGATVLGGWLGLALDDYAVSVLVDALGQPSNYDPRIVSPVCVLQINHGTFQTVSGTNYRYEVLGCPIGFADELGACRDRNCASSTFDIAIYQQTWTDTLQVSSITPKQ